MCSYFIVGNNIFYFFKNKSFTFLDEGTYRGGGGRGIQILQDSEGVVQKGGSDRFIIFFLGGRPW